ncbi:Stk1 family PASTA domain-containing Ser/Thr kinase [Terracoccus luteus]|uniref:non-specific serine/threonine protein kinase n=1 Tax=Terracoccus luteus TaxID=53356 RepID=A0A839PL01_9MICO|nr:Stk1 family PASTA domain-containing Ser/Thr kinase [Terracoccus luteus]MBB2984930.1 serine/threonine-protein kinase [Terracoccus luteus]MCP2170582.1 serine/threonine-protein kinase [Terracoccus luteus]
MTSSVADPLIGRLVDGRYRILSHLADGGMATVYVALDARLDRQVALKVMRPGLAADHVFVERFRSEARSAARLSHPNVVAVFDQGESAGDVFLAMELVDGKTLRDVIHEEAPLTVRESLAILEPILEALRAAHAAGIIHRDVKPENVIVRRDGEVKVADFGLARAITNQTTTSQTGVLLGTVSYLSPEQVERGVADTRSDVYAAGLLLFEMLTGRKAVSGDTPIQIAYKHVHDRVGAPSRLVDTVPAPVDDLVAEATAVEPDDRFDSAAALLAALRSVRRSLPADVLDARGTLAPEGGRDGVDAGRPAAARDAGSRDRRRDDHAATAVLSTGARSYAPPSVGTPTGPVRGLHRDDAPSRPAPVQHTSALALPDRLPARRRRWPWVVAALLLVGGGGAGWWFTGGPGGSTVVPTVVGQQAPVASGRLQAASLDVETDEEFSETAARGTVLRSDPAAGAELGKQSVVRLVVSKGQERYRVPKLAGATADSLAGTLAAQRLSLGKVTEDWSETVKAGTVVSQQPDAGTSVRRSTEVSVVVSKGRQPITVPVVRDQGVDAAVSAIEGAGLTVKRLDDENSDTVPQGAVISQSPADGTLYRGDAVSITVSKGPVMVQVPGVVGRPVAEAEKALTDLGFTVKKEYPFGRLFDLVRVQSVEGGQSVRKGSTIVLTIV